VKIPWLAASLNQRTVARSIASGLESATYACRRSQLSTAISSLVSDWTLKTITT
jgi:hypothetical protein